MKNTFKITTLFFSLMLTPLLAMAAPTSTEIMLNTYMREQATHQVELMLPRGKYNIQVNVSVNQAKIKEENEVQPVKMPMGTTFITAPELKASGATDTSTEHLLTYIEKVQMSVGVVPSISPQVRDLIKSTLVSSLGLDTARGDLVNITELPESFASAWIVPNPIQPAIESAIESLKKPFTYFGAGLGFLILLTISVVFMSFRQMGTRLSSEARNMTVTLKDAIETGSVNSGSMSMNNQAMATVANKAGNDVSESTFWEKMDIDTIAAFCFDCVAHPKYSSIPGIIVSHLIEPARVTELEKSFPFKYIKQIPGEKFTLKTPEVTQIFQMYLSEYRRAIRSPMSRQVLPVEISQLYTFSETLEKMEVALLINSLTPMKRSLMLQELSATTKLDLAEVAKQNLSAVEHKRFEMSLTEKVAAIVGTEDQKEEFHSLDYLTSIILKADSYVDDESIFNKVRESGQGSYSGILQAFDLFGPSDWSEMNLQETAMAFTGYSSNIKEQLYAHFSGKKLEWLKNFVAKFEAKVPEYQSTLVQSVHDNIKEKIRLITENSDKADHDESNSQKQAV